MKKFIMKMFLFLILLGFNQYTTYASVLGHIAGSNRYETAALISDKINYSTAILVNGQALVDGLSASGLSGSITAPILLTETNSIPSVTFSKLQKVNTVYLIGSTGVISSKVENIIIDLGKKVIRLGGIDRYDTSYKVANEIERIKGITELYYVNGITGLADAMSIAPVAALKGNPVLLTDGKSAGYSRPVKSYAIGGVGVLNSTFDSFSERINGSNRFDTNKNVISKFYPNKKHVNLSKSEELIDALTASALKQPIVLVDSYSDKSIVAGCNSATALGNINPIAVNRTKAYIWNDNIVFYVQHQDDETLFTGSAIIDAIQCVGVDNVYVVLITDGANTSVFNSSRYINLTRENKSTLRNNEFYAALARLGVKSSNISLLNQPENNVNINVLKNKVLEFESKFSSVTHVAHSYKRDLHPQHLATGSLVNNLYKDGFIKDCRFFVGTENSSNLYVNNTIESFANNNGERIKVINACNEYILDKKDMIREGIGYKSVQTLFNNLIDNSLVPSYLHDPGI